MAYLESEIRVRSRLDVQDVVEGSRGGGCKDVPKQKYEPKVTRQLNNKSVNRNRGFVAWKRPYFHSSRSLIRMSQDAYGQHYEVGKHACGHVGVRLSPQTHKQTNNKNGFLWLTEREIESERERETEGYGNRDRDREG